MSSETYSGSGDEEDSSREYDPDSLSLSDSLRETTSEVTPRKRSTHVKRNRGKWMVSSSGVNRSPSNSEEDRAGSLVSFVSHRLVDGPPPIPAVIRDGIVTKKALAVEDLSNLGQPTILSLSAVEELARSIPWPPGIDLCLPERGGTSLARYENSMVIFVASLDAGFRLPLPDFYRDFLTRINVNPTQLYPNAWRYLSGYTMRCYSRNLSPDADHILKLFTLKSAKGFCNLSSPKLKLISKPSNVGTWKDRWFLARCSSPVVFNSPLYPGRFRRAAKGDKKEIDACKKQFRTSGPAPDYRRVITQNNLEKAGLSLPCAVRNADSRRVDSGMKSELLAKRARKLSSATEATSKVVVNQTSEEEGAPVAIEPPGMSDIPSSLQVHTDGVQSRVVESDAPSETNRLEKRRRCESRSDAEPSSSIPSYSFSAPVPSMEELQLLLPPKNDICVREKGWWLSMKPDDFQVEAMKYIEMARLGMWTSTEYTKYLYKKGIDTGVEKPNLSKKVDELNAQNQQLIEELASAKAKVISLEGEKQTLVDENFSTAQQKARIDAENARLAEHKALVDKANARLEDEKVRLVESHELALVDNDRETAELKRKLEDLNIQTEKARVVSDYLVSVEFHRRLADEVGPHWEQGMRIGVRQAVKKFGEIDPRIKYFTPDYTDVCGEPELEA